MNNSYFIIYIYRGRVYCGSTVAYANKGALGGPATKPRWGGGDWAGFKFGRVCSQWQRWTL